jgi:cytochrome c oxidase assembly factor CtaG
MRTLIALVLLLIRVSPAAAHGGDPHAELDWTFDPWVVTPILVVSGLHGAGTLGLWQRRKQFSARLTVSLALFWLGMAVMVIALVSPLHDLGEHLFAAHMMEHELVMIVAAPLLVLARPVGLLLWGLPKSARHRGAAAMKWGPLRVTWGGVTLPLVATFLHGLAIWAWHAPAFFDATVTDLLLHRLQHLSFFLTGFLFWWSIIWRCDRGTAAWHLFVTMMHTGILGALIALAPNVIYLTQTRFSDQWGLTALEDQQLAGLIMWVPGGIIYAAAALCCMATWILSSSEGGKRADRFYTG